MLTVGKLLEIAIKNHLTINQAVLVLSLLEEKQTRTNLINYTTLKGPLPEREVNELKERGLIWDINVEGESNPFKMMAISEKLETSLMIDTDVYAKEYWNAYPNSITIQGKKFLGKNMPFHEFTMTYNEHALGVLENGKAKHEQYMNDLKKAKELGLVNVGLKRWMSELRYETISEVFKEGGELHPDTDFTDIV